MHKKVKPIWMWITRKDPAKIIVVVIVLALSFLSWYFSFRYATNSITELSNKLTLETVEKVSVYIENYLSAPITSISLSASLMSTRILDPYENSSAIPMLRHCWDALRLNPILRSYSISLPIPGYVGYINLGGEIVQIADWYPLTEPYLQYYILTVDANGTANYSNSDTWLVANPDININEDPQMIKCAANPDESFWNMPYIFPPSPDEVWIAYVRPFRDFFTGEYSGAVSCDFTVNSIGEYLQQIKPTTNTKSMITDSEFNVIANSVGEFPFIVDPGNETVTFTATPVAATSLEDSILSDAAKRLPDIYKKMKNTGVNIVQTSFKHHGKKQLLLVRRVINLNLDWLVVVVVPNSDFFHKIDVARKTTIWISITGIILSALKILLDHRETIKTLLGIKSKEQTVPTSVSVEAFKEEEHN